MYKKMLVLLDGSELAEIVFEYAQELSGRLHIDLELLHVCTPEEAVQLPMRRAYIERKAEELCTKAEEIRAKYDPDSISQCIYARGTVVVGYPAEEILKYVDEHDIDLVMMSTHGASGIKAWDLGSVAYKVIHACRVPVWLVPSELRREVIAQTLYKKPVVVPLSADKGSEVAIPHAVEIITRTGTESELVLLHVTEVPMAETVAVLEQAELQRARRKEYLETIAQPLRDKGIRVRTELLWGDPAEAIVRYVNDNPTQLLAMATRAKRRLSRMVFGSVTETVIHTVKVTPLLLVGEQQ